MDDVVLFSKLEHPKHIELFQLLRDHSVYSPQVYYRAPDRGRVWQKVGDAKIWDQSHRNIKDKIVLLGGYADIFMDLDNSNKIVYLANKSFLDRRELTLLGKIDYIIAENQFDAFSLSYQVKYHNPRIKVYWLHPWTDTTRYSINQYNEEIVTSDPSWMKRGFSAYKVKHRRFHIGTTAKFCVEPQDLYEATQYLLTGRPLLTSRRFQELVTPGFNGYVADHVGEVVSALNAFKDLGHVQMLGKNGRDLLIAALNPQVWLSNFTKILDGSMPSLAPYKYQRNFSDRKWIIPERTLSGGSFKSYPEKGQYHSSFQVVEYDDLNEIIRFFSRQMFSDAYVFGFQFPEYNREEMAQARNLANRLGERGRKIHFCLDEPIPDEWTYVFSKLSVISREEGLKQVR